MRTTSSEKKNTSAHLGVLKELDSHSREICGLPHELMVTKKPFISLKDGLLVQAKPIRTRRRRSNRPKKTIVTEPTSAEKADDDR